MMFAEITRAPPKSQEGRTTPQHFKGDPRGYSWYRLTRIVRIAQLGDFRVITQIPSPVPGFLPQRPTASTEEKGSLMSQIAKIAAHSGSVVKITWGSENGML